MPATEETPKPKNVENNEENKETNTKTTSTEG